MKASGNGLVQVCAQNLLAIVRGEVVYDRLRGLDARAIDKPAGSAASEVVQDAEWLLHTYEPRATVDGIEVSGADMPSGDFAVTVNIN